MEMGAEDIQTAYRQLVAPSARASERAFILTRQLCQHTLASPAIAVWATSHWASPPREGRALARQAS